MRFETDLRAAATHKEERGSFRICTMYDDVNEEEGRRNCNGDE